MTENTLVNRLYSHWSFMILAIYCFVGLLGSMFFIMSAFVESNGNNFWIGMIVLITSLVAGMYCKIVDDTSTGMIVRDYIDSVPDDRKDMAKRMFDKRYYK